MIWEVTEGIQDHIILKFYGDPETLEFNNQMIQRKPPKTKYRGAMTEEAAICRELSKTREDMIHGQDC